MNTQAGQAYETYQKGDLRMHVDPEARTVRVSVWHQKTEAFYEGGPVDVATVAQWLCADVLAAAQAAHAEQIDFLMSSSMERGNLISELTFANAECGARTVELARELNAVGDRLGRLVGESVLDAASRVVTAAAVVVTQQAETPIFCERCGAVMVDFRQHSGERVCVMCVSGEVSELTVALSETREELSVLQAEKAAFMANRRQLMMRRSGAVAGIDFAEWPDSEPTETALAVIDASGHDAVEVDAVTVIDAGDDAEKPDPYAIPPELWRYYQQLAEMHGPTPSKARWALNRLVSFLDAVRRVEDADRVFSVHEVARATRVGAKATTTVESLICILRQTGIVTTEVPRPHRRRINLVQQSEVSP